MIELPAVDDSSPNVCAVSLDAVNRHPNDGTSSPPDTTRRSDRRASFTHYLPGAGAAVKKNSKGVSKWTSSNVDWRENVLSYWETSGVGICIDIIFAILSAISLIVYVMRTYEVFRSVNELLFLEIAIAICFALEYVARIALMGRKYMFSLLGVIDLCTFLPLLITIFLKENGEEINTVFFRFARSNVAFLRWVKISRNCSVFRHLNSLNLFNIMDQSLAMEVTSLVLSLLGVIIIGTGLIHLVENEMAAEYASSNVVSPLAFHQTFYFIVTTVSTVGYGDYVTRSPLGMFLVLCVMTVSVILIPIQTSKILEMSRHISRTGGSYNARKGAAHVVLFVSSFVRWLELEIFLTEFFHSNHGGLNYQVVLVSRSRLHESVEASLQTHVFSSKVKCLVGSCFEDDTLNRACVGEAQACFVVTHRGEADGMQDTDRDVASILTAMSVKHYCEHVPIFVQVLAPESARGVLWNNLKSYPNTQLVLESCDYEGDGRSTWVDEYLFGCKFEIYPALFHPGFVGMTYGEATLTIYKKFDQILLFAYGSTIPGHFEVRLNPGTYQKITSSHFAYVIADDFAQATQITTWDPRDPSSEPLSENKWLSALNTDLLNQLENIFDMETFDPLEIDNSSSANTIANKHNRCILDMDFSCMHNHIVCGGHIDSTISRFIEPLRDKNLPKIIPIVLVVSEITSELKSIVQRFTETFCFAGDLIDPSTAHALNVHHAHNVLIFSNPNSHNAERELGDVDHRTISTLLAVENHIKKCSKISNTTVEIRFTSSLRFLRPALALKERTSLTKTDQNKLNTADGKVYVTGMLESVQVQAFYNPRVIRVLSTLIKGSWIETSNDANEPSSRYFIQLLLVDIPPEFSGKEYGVIFEALVISNNWVPCGIYRGQSTFNSPIRYVYSCPPPTAIIASDDHLFVIAVVESDRPQNGRHTRAGTNESSEAKTFSPEDMRKFRVVRSMSVTSVPLDFLDLTPRPLTRDPSQKLKFPHSDSDESSSHSSHSDMEHSYCDPYEESEPYQTNSDEERRREELNLRLQAQGTAFIE